MDITIKIGDQVLGGDNPCFIVAEAGANHDGDFEKAKQLIDAAAATGADAIKFQHYSAAKLASKEAKRYWFVRGDRPGFQFDPNEYFDDQISTFSKIDGMPRDKDVELVAHAVSKGIIFFSTPFDLESVVHLERLKAPLYKIASGDITYHELLQVVARTGKPIVLSTGASTVNEIRAAVNVMKAEGNNQIILLHCTLAYPTPLHKANLLMMRHLGQEFPDLLIGLSDHTPGVEADVAAAMLGAVMIEKHFTHTPGPAAGAQKVGESPDHDIGIDSNQFTELVRRVRAHESIGRCSRMKLSFEEAKQIIVTSPHPEVLGQTELKDVDTDVELKARLQARRSVVVDQALTKGTVISDDMVKSGAISVKRPGTGIPPYDLHKLIGKKLLVDLAADSVLKWEHFE